MSLSGRFLGEALRGKCVFNASGPTTKKFTQTSKTDIFTLISAADFLHSFSRCQWVSVHARPVKMVESVSMWMLITSVNARPSLMVKIVRIFVINAKNQTPSVKVC